MSPSMYRSRQAVANFSRSCCVPFMVFLRRWLWTFREALADRRLKINLSVVLWLLWRVRRQRAPRQGCPYPVICSSRGVRADDLTFIALVERDRGRLRELHS